MSRLIVKNLPKNITTEKLRESFSTKGTVTDVQLKYTKDGKFRHFGFVGYKTEEECKAALDYYNNTYLSGSRIKVEVCSDLGDPNKPKSWSKYASDSSTATKTVESPEDQTESKSKKTDEDPISKILEKHKGDALFEEFIETHSKKNKTIWGNDAIIAEDDVANTNSASSKKERPSEEESGEDSGGDEYVEEESDEKGESEEKGDDEDEEKPLADQDISDLEYLQRLKGKKTDEKDELKEKATPEKKKKKDPIPLFTVKIRGLGFKARKSHVRHFFHPLKPYSIRLPPKVKGIAYVGFKTEKEMKQALNKSKGFLSGRQIVVTRYEEKDASGKDDENNSRQWKWKDQEESLRSEESIGESGRIFVRNLAHTITEEDIETLFSKY
ncbi:hypothetical protein J437_LFUL002647, partial [Ladona fulva]